MDIATPSRKNVWLYGIIGVIVLMGLWIFGSYNGLVRARESLDNTWANVETQYQRRFDLIPKLVNTVKGASNFEQGTLTQVTAARTQWMNSSTREGKVAAADQLDSALSRLLVTVEAYPQLQATQTYRDLITELEGTENRISTARRDYNDEVRSYNVTVKTFPRSIIAGMLGFGPEAFFKAAPGSDKAPDVNFQ